MYKTKFLATTLIITLLAIDGCSSQTPIATNIAITQLPASTSTIIPQQLTKTPIPFWTQKNTTIFDLRDKSIFGDFGASIYRVSVASDGDVWINLKNALGKFDGENWTIYPMPKSMIVNGNQIVGLDDVLLALPDNKVWITLGKVEEDFPYETIHHLYFFDGEIWNAFTKEDGILENNVYSAAIDNNTRSMWFSTSGVAINNGRFERFYPGVSKFDGTNWTSYQNITGSIAVDPSGMLWIYSGQDISSFDGKSLTTHSNIRDKLFSKNCDLWESHITNIVDMDFSSGGIVWALFQECGIAKYYKGKWSSYESSEIFKKKLGGTEICTSPDGKLWLLREENLYQFDIDLNILSKQNTGLGVTGSLACAPDGSIWIGSLSGYVAQYKP